MKKSNIDTERFAECYAKAQMLTGTATAQTIIHFLKRKSRREKLELDNLEAKNVLLHEQAEKIREDRNQEQLYQEAIDAMRDYTGHSND